MWRDSCRVNNPSCCELPRCDVHYEMEEGICYLCKQRHEYLENKKLEEGEAEDEQEEGEICEEVVKEDQEDLEEKHDELAMKKNGVEKEAQNGNRDIKSKRAQLEEVENSIEAMQMMDDEYVFQLLVLSRRV
jgi:hypothetical protein